MAARAASAMILTFIVTVEKRRNEFDKWAGFQEAGLVSCLSGDCY